MKKYLVLLLAILLLPVAADAKKKDLKPQDNDSAQTEVTAKKPKKEKNELGLWKGTKKAYTFELTLKGYDLERVTRRVLKHFPEANEKSIKQWYKAALKSK